MMPSLGAEIDGFKLAVLVAHDVRGDALVQAPDGSRGMLVWEDGPPDLFETLIEPQPGGSWGTFGVTGPEQLTSNEEVAEYLRSILPLLRARWETWKGLGR
jgi:hypothetical protein